LTYCTSKTHGELTDDLQMTYRLTLTATASFAALLLLFATAVFADTLTGKVVKITDGDFLYVLGANYKEYKIRLAGIDTPERKQAYGLASRKHLASIVAGKRSSLLG